LQALPWGWRFAFPTICIKPAAHVFTGWRRSLRFRLVTNPRFGDLHDLYRNLLAAAPAIAIQKYRCTIHEATALLHYRFEGEREQAIHDWCYAGGDKSVGQAGLEPIGTYVQARRALVL